MEILDFASIYGLLFVSGPITVEALIGILPAVTIFISEKTGIRWAYRFEKR